MALTLSARDTSCAPLPQHGLRSETVHRWSDLGPTDQLKVLKTRTVGARYLPPDVWYGARA